MTTLRTILRDLAATAARAAERAVRQSGRSGEATGTAGDRIDVPDLATVEDSRRARRDRTDERVHGGDGVHSPGQVGPSATVEVAPRDLELVRTTYNPDTDGDPDPGEVVWTWVPYEEADGRGKDRPVLVVARVPDGVLAVQLSSRDHGGDRDWVALGAGAWDGEHRPSWVDLDRLLLVRPGGMRREAAILDPDRFDRVTHALSRRHHWPTS